MKPDLRFL